MRKLQFCLAVFALLALSIGALAQVQNGQFAGIVTDSTGAARRIWFLITPASATYVIPYH